MALRSLTMAFDPSVYGITIARREIEGESVFEATIREFPDVKEYGDSYEEAYELALDSIRALNAAAQEEGWFFPAPAAPDQTFSGRITLRMPKFLHRIVALRADEEGVSLNAYLCTVIANAGTPAKAHGHGQATVIRSFTKDLRKVSFNQEVWSTLRQYFETDHRLSHVSAVHEPRPTFTVIAAPRARQ
jgi:predicted HicB family RNase H-like nuclease